MLTEEEAKELTKLSPELREKVEAMFNSPYYLGYEALSSQYQAYCKELKDKPFTIETNEDFSKYAEFENADKIIMAISATQRGKAETALKVAKELPSMAMSIVDFQLRLTPEEQQKANKVATAASLREEVLGGKK